MNKVNELTEKIALVKKSITDMRESKLMPKDIRNLNDVECTDIALKLLELYKREQKNHFKTRMDLKQAYIELRKYVAKSKMKGKKELKGATVRRVAMMGE